MLPIRKKIWPLIAILLLILTPSLSFDYFLSTDPTKAPLPKEERHGYLEDWTSGYGLKEIASYLTNVSKDREILVVTEGSFGTLPDGLQIYLGGNKNISIWYSTSILSQDVYNMARVEPTYFIVNKSRLTANRDLTLIKEYPRAMPLDGKTDALLLYQITQ